MDYGNLGLRIDELLQSRDISKNQLCKALDIPRTNLNRYCRNDFQRLDAALLCKLCWYLGVDINELLVYHPPEQMNENTLRPFESANINIGRTLCADKKPPSNDV